LATAQERSVRRDQKRRIVVSRPDAVKNHQIFRTSATDDGQRRSASVACTMSELLELAERAARAAGEVIRSGFGSAASVTHKGEVDLVTEVDRAAERQIIPLIRAAHPDHAILAEESGQHPGAKDTRWLVDPLDGTTNFAHGHPHLCVSIAAETCGQLEVGVVYDPLRREMFRCARGRGASLNDRPIRVSTTLALESALLGTGFPYDRRVRAAEYLVLVEAILRRAQGIRRAGSAALDLCYVAAGRLDAFWEAKLQPWDVAAGRLMVEEAGGLVTSVDGALHTLDSGDIVASNGALHAELLAALVPPPATRDYTGR